VAPLLIEATESDYGVIENLSAYHIYDMSEFTGWRCPESGRYGGCDRFFEDWRAGRNCVYIIKAGGELAGFAGVCQDDERVGHAIQEFFVLRKFRRRGVGRRIAFLLFDRFPGQWTVRFLTANAPAAGFWRAAIGEYTSGQFTEAASDSAWGPIATLRFSS